MSDHQMVIIPADPRLVPSVEQSSALAALLTQWMPEAETISTETSANVEFRDCGENFEYVACPACKRKLEITEWHQLMDQDYDLQQGFQLRSYTLPCCGHQAAVNQLTYSFMQGFSRFALTATNPDSGPLSEQQLTRLRQLLGCEVIVIYRHI
ncbi:hypothetical protein QE250_08915 [Chromatiaceae bacterium AAb-1]|nr:hypothetical protein [Chromatiaceae bacterium AAb-1]